LPFGNREGDSLPALRIPLGDDNYLEINGKIDRVDMALGENKNWFRVIDYKTGREGFNLQDIFNGLRLQLLVYLQVVLANTAYFGVEQKDAAAAGMYYALIHDNMQASNGSADEENEKIAGLRFEGLSIKEQEAVLLADSTIKGHSKLIPVALGKDGFYANSPGVDSAQLELLMEHLQEILKETAINMLGGVIAAKPLRNKNFDACTYCDYKAFCGFDMILVASH
jgi:ATP-dependent helicase/nuclease subunit B